MSVILAYITTANAEEADNIGTCLVKEKLAACVNILPHTISIYEWKEGVEKNTETILIAKTKAVLGERLMQRTKELHSYECPAIVLIEAKKCPNDFAEWVDKNTI
jgi:periplasmic divalent cation tolerance protein